MNLYLDQDFGTLSFSSVMLPAIFPEGGSAPSHPFNSTVHLSNSSPGFSGVALPAGLSSHIERARYVSLLWKGIWVKGQHP